MGWSDEVSLEQHLYIDHSASVFGLSILTYSANVKLDGNQLPGVVTNGSARARTRCASASIITGGFKRVLLCHAKAKDLQALPREITSGPVGSKTSRSVWRR